MDDRSAIARLLIWLWRDGPVWITVGGILFLIVVGLRYIGGGGTGGGG